ncbi:hypothetical protein [Kutzneria kofuensis]|uniref:Uncharacterized protein n=1 Tax=Kutzneria kofuensis TaxID=103725 RepID=A0A7W9KCI9_9PSEU|nr:hypothetical protein [Kutzneria kofuensis]MBB5890098.1 hypothetical protein [Kutzneria kofuensis]
MKGLAESRTRYEVELLPKLRGIPHAAARIGHGSEVLGFDTDRSRDHDWGPFVQIFVPDPAAVPVEAFRPGDWLRGHLASIPGRCDAVRLPPAEREAAPVPGAVGGFRSPPLDAPTIKADAAIEIWQAKASA